MFYFLFHSTFQHISYIFFSAVKKKFHAHKIVQISLCVQYTYIVKSRINIQKKITMHCKTFSFMKSIDSILITWFLFEKTIFKNIVGKLEQFYWIVQEVQRFTRRWFSFTQNKIWSTIFFNNLISDKITIELQE